MGLISLSIIFYKLVQFCECFRLSKVSIWWKWKKISQLIHGLWSVYWVWHKEGTLSGLRKPKSAETRFIWAWYPFLLSSTNWFSSANVSDCRKWASDESEKKYRNWSTDYDLFIESDIMSEMHGNIFDTTLKQSSLSAVKNALCRYLQPFICPTYRIWPDFYLIWSILIFLQLCCWRFQHTCTQNKVSSSLCLLIAFQWRRFRWSAYRSHGSAFNSDSEVLRTGKIVVILRTFKALIFAYFFKAMLCSSHIYCFLTNIYRWALFRLCSRVWTCTQQSRQFL